MYINYINYGYLHHHFNCCLKIYTHYIRLCTIYSTKAEVRRKKVVDNTTTSVVRPDDTTLCQHETETRPRDVALSNASILWTGRLKSVPPLIPSRLALSTSRQRPRSCIHRPLVVGVSPSRVLFLLSGDVSVTWRLIEPLSADILSVA